MCGLLDYWGITKIETLAVGTKIRELARLRKQYGRGRWRKRKGIARVQLADGTVRVAEIHWYEATDQALSSVSGI